MYFESFLRGFKTLTSGGCNFTPLQIQMLDEIIAGNHFQVSSPDLNCGSGKTTLTVAATVGSIGPADRIIVVSRLAKSASPLLSQMEVLVNRFSDGHAKVATVDRKDSIYEKVQRNQILIVPSSLFPDVIRVARSHLTHLHSSTSFSLLPPKIYLIFDESHQLFPAMSYLSLSQFFGQETPHNSHTSPCECVGGELGMSIQNG